MVDVIDNRTTGRKRLLFAPCSFNLAETVRMLEIAKEVARHPVGSNVFDIHFISDGGDSESLIENHGPMPFCSLSDKLK